MGEPDLRRLREEKEEEEEEEDETEEGSLMCAVTHEHQTTPA